MAPNGSYCSSCFLLAPIVSYCLLAALIVSYWLLMAPLAPVVSYWLLLVPIRSYWLLLALYFSKKENALPVHLLRQVTGSAGTAMDVLVTCFSKMGGESERRGCRYRAQLVVRGGSRGDSENIFESRFSFSPNVSET